MIFVIFLFIQCTWLMFVILLPIYTRGNEAEEKKRPVIIHRAMLGSVERMIAILTESYAGKWYVLLEI